MTKKYRLKINYSEITKGNIKKASDLKDYGYDNECCKQVTDTYFEFRTTNGESVNWDLSDIPKSWLTEIKEPLTMGEAWERHSNLIGDPKHSTGKQLYEYGWTDCILNQKIDPQGGFEEWFNNNPDFYAPEIGVLGRHLKTWNAALKYARVITDK